MQVRSGSEPHHEQVMWCDKLLMFVAKFLYVYVGNGYGGVVTLGTIPLRGLALFDAPDISPPPDARSYSIKAFILVVMEAKISSIRQTSSCKWRYQSFWGILPCWFSSSPIPFIGIVGRNSASWVHLDREVELGVDWAARWRRESLLDCSKMLPRVPFVFHRVSLRASL